MSKPTGAGLLVIRTDVKSSGEDEFNDWYTNVHLPDIVEVPGFRWGRRYRLADSNVYKAPDDLQTYLAIYELDDVEVLESEEFATTKGWGPVGQYPERTQVAVYELIRHEDGAAA
jgi:hypothetical protein